MPFAIVLGLVANSAVFAADPPTQPAIRPIGPWVAAFEFSACRLERDFGSKSRPTTLVFEQLPTSRHVTAHIFEPGLRTGSSREKAKVGFGPMQPEIETAMEIGNIPSLKLRFHRLWLSRDEFERTKANQLISFSIRDRRHSYALPGIAKALATLDECHVDLLASWGLSRELQARTSRFPEPLFGFVSSDDYPEKALSSGSSGRAYAYVHVDVRGRASNCKVSQSSDDSSLDRATCDALVRARFKPAIDKDGQPIDSLYATTINWRVSG